MEEKLGKGVLSGNIKEHEEFVPKLEALDEWCKKVQKGEVVYDGNVFMGMVDSFADTMVAHLTHVCFIYMYLQFITKLSNLLLIINYRNSKPWTAMLCERILP